MISLNLGRLLLQEVTFIVNYSLLRIFTDIPYMEYFPIYES
ncbi:hypothetical protein ALT1644_440029 [Alteromonas macleodii]